VTQDRIARLLASLAVVGVLAFAYVQSNDRHHAEVRARNAEVTSEALAAQVEQLGGEPVEEPDTATSESVVVVPGPPGTPGRDGRDGRDGVDGKDGQSTPGPMGLTGEAGRDGTDGDDGEDGADGAPCDPALNPDCQGPPGADGRGIATMDCVEGDLVTTYTDGGTSAIEDSPACPNGPVIVP
jgi:Collagen triple helix repeat (20 copies)